MAALARWVGLAVMAATLLSLGCRRGELQDRDAGTGTVIPGSGDARIDLAVFDLAGGGLSQDEWRSMTAPRTGEHAVDDRASNLCQPVAIGQDYHVAPPVLCDLVSDYPSPVYACSVRPYCTRHDECKEHPYGSCRGQPVGRCIYPATVLVTCTSDADCTAPPGGHCPAEGDGVTSCYPTGNCDPPDLRTCIFPGGSCAGDSDCTRAAGGYCSKVILFAECQYQICMTDADCEAGTRCLCGAIGNACIPADCDADSDCGAGHQCVLVSNCLGSAYHCSTDLDSCHGDADCRAGELCKFADARWQCQAALCGDAA